MYRFLAMAFAALFLVGCAPQEPAQTGAVATPTNSQPEASSSSSSSSSSQAGSSAGSGSVVNGVVIAGPRPGSISDFIEKSVSDTVNFDYDKFDIRSDQEDVLRRQAAWLRIYKAASVTVEGHADERGTREYNLALGERRAAAVKSFLVSLGVSASRITTISYGKERPAAFGSNKDAWAANRRGVTRIN